jgi:hypothetical protein
MHKRPQGKLMQTKAMLVIPLGVADMVLAVVKLLKRLMYLMMLHLHRQHLLQQDGVVEHEVAEQRAVS